MSGDANGNGAGRVSEGFAKLKVKSWFPDSVPRNEHAMKQKLTGEEAQVHLALSPLTMGFQQELAVIPIGGDKTRNAQPSDIAAMTGMPATNVWRAIEGLKRKGLADHDGKTKGNVRLYAWAVPRKATETEDSSHAGDEKRRPRGVHPTLFDHFKAFRISIPKDFRLTREMEIELEPKADRFVSAKDDLIAGLKAAARQAGESRGTDKVLARNVNGTHADKNASPRGADFDAVSSKTYLEVEEKKRTGGRAASVGNSARPPAESITKQLREFLTEKFSEAVGTVPDPRILMKIATHIPDENALHQFMKAAARAKPREGWALFASIAAQCAAQRKAKGLDASARLRPQSAEERDAEELATYLMDLDNPDLSEAEHEAARQKIAAAPAAITAEARRRYEAAAPKLS